MNRIAFGPRRRRLEVVGKEGSGLYIPPDRIPSSLSKERTIESKISYVFRLLRRQTGGLKENLANNGAGDICQPEMTSLEFVG